MISLGEYTGLRPPLPCARKVAHASRGKADAALRSLRRRVELDTKGKVVYEADGFHSYKCRYCGHWHTGHEAGHQKGSDASDRDATQR